MGSTVKTRMIKLLSIAFTVIVFGPFALLFAAAIVEINLTGLPAFGAWFMLALAVCGMITFVDLILSGIKKRRFEWLLIIIVGAVTFWWLRITVRQFF